MKATEQYFPVVLFIMLYKVVLAFEFVDRKFEGVTIQTKATIRSVTLLSLQKEIWGLFQINVLVYLTVIRLN